MILSERPNDDDAVDGFTKWPFMTTHTWAEYPRGKWTLEVVFINGPPQAYFVFLEAPRGGKVGGAGHVKF